LLSGFCFFGAFSNRLTGILQEQILLRSIRTIPSGGESCFERFAKDRLTDTGDVS
jgi:hypothetical protein